MTGAAPVVVLDEIDSTNAEARRRAEAGGLGLADGPDLKGAGGGDAARDETRTAQEGAAVHDAGRQAGDRGLEPAALDVGGFTLDQHGAAPLSNG